MSTAESLTRGKKQDTDGAQAAERNSAGNSNSTLKDADSEGAIMRHKQPASAPRQ